MTAAVIRLSADSDCNGERATAPGQIKCGDGSFLLVKRSKVK
jgi:hypothetical protein